MSRLIDLDNVEFLKVEADQEFNHGVDCCVETLLKQEPVKAIPFERLKDFRNSVMNMNSIAIIQRLDKLIEEVEDSEAQRKEKLDPAAGRMSKPILEDCSILCQITANEMESEDKT